MDLNKVKKKTHEGGHVKLGERITRRSRRLDSEALVKDDQQVMGNSPSGILPDLDILGLSSSSLQTRHSSGNANVKYLGDGKRQNALSKGLNEEREDINNSSEDKIIKVDVDKKLSRATIKVHHLQDNPEIKKPLHHTLVLSGFMNIYSSNIFDIHVIPPRVMDEEISSVDFMDNTGGLSKDSYSLKFNNSSQSPLKKQQRGNLLKKSVKKTARGPLIVTRVTTKGKENALNQNLLVKSKSNIKGTNGQVKEHHDNSGSMGQTKLEILVDNKLSGNSANDENTPEVSLTGDQHITSNFHVDEHTLSKFPVIAPTLSEFTLEPVFTIPNFGIIDAPLSHMDEHNQSNLGLTESSRQNMESKTVNNGDGVTDVSCVKYNNLQEQVKGNKLTEVSVRNVSLSGKRNNKTPSMRGNAVKRKMNEEVYKVQTRSNWKTSHQALSCSNTTQDANITLDTSCSPESNINAFEIHALKVYDVLPWQQCFDNMEVGTVIPASVHNPYTLTFQGTFDAGFFLKEAKGLSLFVFKEDCPSLKDKTPIALFIQMSNKDLFKIKGQKKSVNLFIGTKQLGSKTVENSNQNVSTRMFTLGSPASCSTPRHHLGEFGLITPPYSSNAAHNTPNSTSNVFSDSQVCAKPEVSSKHSSCDITPQKSVYLLNDTRLASARMAWHEYQATIAGSFPETLDPEFQPLVIMEKIIKEELEQSLNKDYDKNFDADFDDDDDDDDMNLGRHCRKRYERKGVQQAADTHHSQQEYRPSISTNHTNTKLFPQILCHRQTNVSENTRNLINRKEVEDKLKLFLSREKQFCEKNFDAKNTKANINNADFQNIFGRQGDDCVGEKRQTACGKDNAVSKTKLCSSQPFPKQQINKWSKGESKSAAAIVLKKGYSIR
nr:uncharacterized protein LOC128687710 [Cherax quadricarinatus]